MDPNAALERIRELIESLTRAADSSEDPGERWFAIRGELSELVDTWNGLDGWLSKGGFPPRPWSGKVGWL